jgi:phenylalanyl-tRNA synthetase beta chain
MRVPIGWLKEFVDFDVSPRELGLMLTMTGLEVETAEEVQGDTILDVNVTPNRPDCLSVLGIAREVSALLNLPLRHPHSLIHEEAGACDVKVEILDKDLCYRYAGRAIKGVLISESPPWMQARLARCGMRAINNVVDVTNYVLLETGHPLHAFDMDLIHDMTIRVKRALPGSSMATLDCSVRTLPDEALMIWDGSRPVAVAGIMGGAETEVTEGTKNIFLESAYFLPLSIRRTSKALGLKTESSYRFERDTDIEFLVKALDRAALLISQLAGGEISERVDEYPVPFRPSRIRVRYRRVNRTIGASIADTETRAIAGKLGIDVTEEGESFIAVPPSYRNDIQREIDVIEEIARLYGYDKIPVTAPKIRMSGEAEDRHYSRIAAVRDSLRLSGFTEAVNYSFMNEKALDTLSLPPDDHRRRALSLRNPINEGESSLRTTLVPSLLRNFVHNLSMGNRDIRLFEMSRVFMDEGDALPRERHHLGAVSFRERTQMLWKEEAPEFYLVKGAVEAVLAELKISDYSFGITSEPFLHPGKSCDIIVSGEAVGFLGVLHPKVIEWLSVKLSRQEPVIFEIDLDMLMPHVPEKPGYTPIPRFPHIDRDIAIIVDDHLSAAGIIEEIRGFPTGLIEDVSVFDYYKGSNIPAGKKSLALSVRFRASDRTLTDSEIEDLYQRIVNHVTEKTGGAIRGL